MLFISTIVDVYMPTTYLYMYIELYSLLLPYIQCMYSSVISDIRSLSVQLVPLSCTVFIFCVTGDILYLLSTV